MWGRRGDAAGEGQCGSWPRALPAAPRHLAAQVSRPGPGALGGGALRLPFRKGILEGRSRQGRPGTPRPGDVRVPAPRLGGAYGRRVLGEGGGKGHIWAKAGALPAEGGTAAKREARPRGGPRGNRLTPELPARQRAGGLPSPSRGLGREPPTPCNGAGPASPDAPGRKGNS